MLPHTLGEAKAAHIPLGLKVAMPDVVSDSWVEPASQRSLYDYGSTGKEDNGTEDNTHDEPVSRMTLYEIAGVPTAIEP